ncbi:MAG: PD40 domain-containing protein [Solirubrobacteraceae bacterium]|nr:PD40 domain-containing protein [Solirubrobacteraceae bacterium]
MKRAVIALALLGVSASPASAEWSRARLMSATPGEQALSPESTNSSAILGDPALSGDGRYVAFDTKALNLLTGADLPLRAQSPAGAILRRDADGSGLEVVAPGGTRLARPLTKPAISADGRFVAFVSFEQLAAADTDDLADVYVRDMQVPRMTPGAFALVSSGGPDGAEYELPGSGLSADGRKVLFRRAVGPGATTPLVVWDAATGTATELTSSTSAPFDAALSADGSTVAWLDVEPRLHVSADQYLPGEITIGLGGAGRHNDLLWQRLDGSPARRVTGTGDSEDPGCPPGTPLAPDDGTFTGPRGPCDGVFLQNGVVAEEADNSADSPAGFAALSLSGDGSHVAWASANKRRSGGSLLPLADVFVRDMRGAGGRKATTTEVTRHSAPTSGIATVIGTALSADGRFLAYSTSGSRSLLPSPILMTPTPFSVAAPVELYVGDLGAGIIERVSRSYTGSPASRSAGGLLSSRIGGLSSDGARVAFASDADNLVFGDGNGLGDVFVADRFVDTQQALPTQVSAAASVGETVPVSWRMSVTVSRGGRTLYVDARVPASGTLRATVLPRAGLGRKRGKPTVALASVRTTRPGAVRAKLKLRTPYLSRARRAKGFTVNVRVTFTTRGRTPAFSRTLTSRYRITKKAAQR